MVRHAKHFSLPYGVRRLPPGPPPHILIHCPSHSDRNRFTKLSGEPIDLTHMCRPRETKTRALGRRSDQFQASMSPEQGMPAADSVSRP